MNTSKERGGGQRLECWQKEYVRTPTRKLISLKCVCLVMCTYGARQAGFVYGGGLSLQTCPGARQYSTKHNERPRHKEK